MKEEGKKNTRPELLNEATKKIRARHCSREHSTTSHNTAYTQVNYRTSGNTDFVVPADDGPRHARLLGEILHTERSLNDMASDDTVGALKVRTKKGKRKEKKKKNIPT